MDYANQQKLIDLCNKARYQSKELQDMVQFVCEHKGEHTGGPDVERAIDDFALLTAWMYDMLYDIKPDDKKSRTMKIKKALGYFNA